MSLSFVIVNAVIQDRDISRIKSVSVESVTVEGDKSQQSAVHVIVKRKRSLCLSRRGNTGKYLLENRLSEPRVIFSCNLRCILAQNKHSEIVRLRSLLLFKLLNTDMRLNDVMIPDV